ncbi:unnamed protein product [Knipowitschia caucasica]|uniref:C2H2-type domain-containing protein n=1 Tax=Knipowitschia caucasica TaxID=637954 RepID=A0AAV2IXI1_KNICA
MPQVDAKSPYDSPDAPEALEAARRASHTAEEEPPGAGVDPSRVEQSAAVADAHSRSRLCEEEEKEEEDEEPEKSPVQGSLASSSDCPPEGSRVPLHPQGSGQRAGAERTQAPTEEAPGLHSTRPVSEQKRAPPLSYSCCWDLCGLPFPSSPDLADHIRDRHVDAQRGGMFVCLWKGCKVYNTPSTSQSWLQRHMLSHSGDKPFKCLVGGCTATFSSQGGLARHVPTHFSSHRVPGPRSKDESPSKAGLKRRKTRTRLRRSLPRPHDFFDAQTMDAIRHRAICLNLATHIESLGSGHSVVFHSTVIARRKEDSGKVKLLLHWTPEDILPDAWVNESERLQQKTCVVHLSKLPTDTAVLLDPNIYRMFF